MSALCFMLAPAAGNAKCRDSYAADDTTSPPAYLLVIDHSGSMLEAGAIPSQSRWAEMQSKASSFVRDYIALGSEVWIAVFEDPAPPAKVVFNKPIRTDADRQAALEFIRKYGPPSRRANTALFDTLRMAFAKARELARDVPGRSIMIMSYTDGENDHRVSNVRVNQDPKEVDREYEALVLDNPNIQWTYTTIAGARIQVAPQANFALGRFKIPLPVELQPREVTLDSPALNSEPIVGDVEFSFNSATARLLSGQTVNIVFQPDDPAQWASSPPRVIGSPFPLQCGERFPIRMEIPDTGKLSPRVTYRGKLKFEYPQLENAEIQAPRTINVTFQKNEPPQIDLLRPRAGERFAAGQEVPFHVNTLQGATILVEFGDGGSVSTVTGKQVTHAYLAKGDRTVRITVTAPGKPQSTTETVVRVVDPSVSLDPFPGTRFEGMPYRLACSGDDSVIRDYVWVVDGADYKGRARSDGKSGNELEFVFDKVGMHRVSVLAVADLTTATSRVETIEIHPRPELAITEPEDGVALRFGEEFACSASASTVFGSLSWQLFRTDGRGHVPVGESIVRPLEPAVGGRMVSHVRRSVAEETAAREVELVATGIAREGLAVPETTAGVRLRFAPPEREVVITSPVEGETVMPGDSVKLTANVKAPDIKEVIWNVTGASGSAMLAETTRSVLRDTSQLPFVFSSDCVPGSVEIRARAVVPRGVIAPAPESRVRITVGQRQTLSIDPIPSPVFQGARLVLGCSGSSGLRDYRFVMLRNGGTTESFVGRTRSDGKPGAEFTYPFAQAGRHWLVAEAYAGSQAIASPERVFDVLPEGKVSITAPAVDSRHVFDTEIPVRISIRGPYRQALLVAANPVDGRRLVERPVKLGEAGGDVRTVDVSVAIAEETGAQRVYLSAIAEGRAGINLPETSDTLAIELRSPEREVVIKSPADGSSAIVGDLVTFVADVKGPDISQVEWKIADPGRWKQLEPAVTRVIAGQAQLPFKLDPTVQPGEMTVTATAVMPPRFRGAVPSRTVRVHVNQRLSVALDPVASPLYQGTQLVLGCFGSPALGNYRFLVCREGGTTESYGGRGRADGRPGAELPYPFAAPGRYRVAVEAFAGSETVRSPEVRLDVQPEPKLSIVSPARDTSHTFGEKIRLSATATGFVDSVVWTVYRVDDATSSVLEKYPAQPAALSATGEKTCERDCVVDEASKASVVVIEARAPEVPSGYRGVWPADGVKVRLVAPRRAVKITQPAAGSTVYYGDEQLFRTEVTGSDVEFVSWSITDAATGKTVQPSTKVRVATESGGRFSELRSRLTDETVREISVAVTGELTRPLDVSPLTDSLRLKAGYRPLSAEIRVSSQPLHWGHDSAFELVCSRAVDKVLWEFGDGSEDRSGTTIKPVHRYERPGHYDVVARVVAKGGDSIHARLQVAVVATDPVASLLITRNGRPVDNVFMDEMVELSDHSRGDVARREWLVDGQAHPDSGATVSLQLRSAGTTTVTLRVQGPPGKDGSAGKVAEAHGAVAVRKKPNWMAFGIAAAVGMLLFLLILWRHTGNQPAGWDILFRLEDEEYQQDRHCAVRRYWRKWAKRADIPLSRILRASAYWSGGRGKEEQLVVRGVRRLFFGCRTGYMVASTQAVSWHPHTSSSGQREYDKDFYLVVKNPPGPEPGTQPDPFTDRVYFRLHMRGGTSTLDVFICAGAAIVLAALLLQAYSVWILNV